jgi:hypothetical protein
MQSGAVYRNTYAKGSVWTASTIELAMVVDLLTRQPTDTITFCDWDKTLMSAMLHSSDDEAAGTLWSPYSGAAGAEALGVEDVIELHCMSGDWKPGWQATTSTSQAAPNRLVDHDAVHLHQQREVTRIVWHESAELET